MNVNIITFFALYILSRAEITWKLNADHMNTKLRCNKDKLTLTFQFSEVMHKLNGLSNSF